VNFASDNVYGVDPRIMQAMVDANARLTDFPKFLNMM
jgi:threonine aldolase